MISCWQQSTGHISSQLLCILYCFSYSHCFRYS